MHRKVPKGKRKKSTVSCCGSRVSITFSSCLQPLNAPVMKIELQFGSLNRGWSALIWRVLLVFLFSATARVLRIGIIPKIIAPKDKN
jgi:hypothetical protein